MSSLAKRKPSVGSIFNRAHEGGQRPVSEFDHGYLSDVQAQGSNAPSEVSNDFVASTEVLERHFKDKYKVLSDAYEQRIKDLASVIYETCERLLTDSVIDEMKQDHASCAFIPAHIIEIVEKQLSAERERYIHDLVTKMGNMKLELVRSHEVIKAQTNKLGQMDADLSKSRKAELLVESLQGNLEQLKGQLEELNRRSEEDIRNLQWKNTELEKKESDARQHAQKLSIDFDAKTREFDTLKRASEMKQLEIERLNRSYEDTTRAVTALEESGIEEKQEKRELNEQIRRLTDQNSLLKQELSDMKVQMKFTNDELSRTKDVLGSRVHEETSSRQHVAALMSQIETMLEEEESESNAAILSLQDRMRKMKHKLTLEVQSERRINVTLRDELNQLSKDKEEKARELKSSYAEISDLREKINLEQMKAQSLQLTLQELNEITLDSKARAAEAETRMQLAETRLHDLEDMIPTQLQLAEERAKLKVTEEAEQERSRIDTKTSAYRLHYQNQLGELQNQLRHSFTFGDNSSYAAAGGAGGGSHGGLGLSGSSVAGAGVLSAEVSAIKAAQENWNADRTRLESVHHGDLKAAEKIWQIERAKLEGQHELALARLQMKLESDHRESMSAMQKRLEEAGDNIGRLKLMVLNGREGSQSLMNQLRARINELEAENGQIKRQNADLDDTGDRMQRLIEEQEVTNKELKGANDGLVATIAQLRRSISELEQASSSGLYASKNSQQLQELQRANTQLQVELKECREQAMNEQSQEASALEQMKRKFDVLVKRYEEQLALPATAAAVAPSNHNNDNASVSTLDSRSTSPQSLNAHATHTEVPTTSSSHGHGQLNRSMISQQSGFSEISHITQNSRPTLTMQSPPSTTQGRFTAALMSPMPINPNINRVGAASAAAAAAAQDSTSSSSSDDASDHNHNGSSGRDRITAQLSTIRNLERNLKVKVELADSTLRELEFERGRGLKHRRQSERLFKLVANLEDGYKDSVRDLRKGLSVLRDVAEGINSIVAIEVRRITRSVGIMSQQMFERTELRKKQELEALQIRLARAHEDDRALLERGYNITISELTAQHDHEIKRLQAQVSEAVAASQRTEADASVRIEAVYKEINSASSTRDTTTASSQQHANHHSFVAAGSYNNNSRADTMETTRASMVSPAAYESVLRGVLDALTNSSVIPIEVAEEVVAVAVQEKLSSFQALSTARSVLADHLTSSAAAQDHAARHHHNASVISLGGSGGGGGGGHIRSASGGGSSGPAAGSSSMFGASSARGSGGGLYFDSYASGGGGGNAPADFETSSVVSEMRDGSISGRAFDVAVGELEQTRHEQAMLLDLARIQHEAQVRNLAGRIDDLQKQHRQEIGRIQAEAEDSEKILRSALKDELESRGRESHEKLLEAERKLGIEQERRHQLQAKLSNLEILHQKEVKALEQKIVGLQQRAEQAELVAARLRMEAVHQQVYK